MKILAAYVDKAGMRDVRSLLKPGVTADKVADYKWRSPEEVAFYVNSLRNAEDFTVTASLDRNKLNKAYADLVSLQGKLDTLTGLDIVITYEFRKDKARLSELVSSIRAAFEARRDKALRALQKSARKKEPESLRLMVSETALSLSQRLKGQYSEVSDYVYAVPYGERGLEFNHYIHVSNLHNDYTDFTFPDYYVVVTMRVEGESKSLHINTLHEFRAPGSFNIGQTVTIDTLPSSLSALLDADEFLSDLDSPDLPELQLTPSMFKTPVQSVCLVGSSIEVGFECDRKTAVGYTRTVLGELKAMFQPHLPGYVFKCRLVRKGTGRWLSVYKAAPTPNGTVLDSVSENVLKHQLNLNPRQLSVIRKALIKGY